MAKIKTLTIEAKARFKARFDDELPEWKSPAILKFEIAYVTFSLAVVIFQIIVMILAENEKITIGIRKGIGNNIGWLFTQFTWWTNILITLCQIYRMALRKTVLDSPIKAFLLGKAWYINWTCYIFIVGTLFFAGQFYSYMLGKSETPTVTIHDPSTPESFLIFGEYGTNATSTFAHFINPLVYIVMFIILVQKRILIFAPETLTYQVILKRTGLGLIYPMVYLTFYVIFALYAYDPYPVSDLQNNNGWWIGAVVPTIFFGLIFLLWWIVKKRSESTMRLIQA